MPGERSLDSRVLSQMEAALVPGVSMALVREGEIEHITALGVRNADARQPVSAETVFQAASLSKPVFAHAVLQLVDAGTLQLDEPLSGFVPPLVPDDPASLRITARHVLRHTTGLPNWRREKYPLRTYFPPGSRFSYSGEAFVYLQSAIERLTGEPLDAIAKRLVFDPFGMERSSYVWNDRFADNHASPHDTDGTVKSQHKPLEANAAHSLHTTAADYGRFLDGVVRGARLKEATARLWLVPQACVPRGRVEALERESPETELDVAWGLGWGLEPEAGFFFHWRANPGTQAFALGSQAQRAALVIFANSDNGLTIVPEIAASMMPGGHDSMRWLGMGEPHE